MANENQQIIPPPFAPGYRASGVLLHVASLPSRFGIGDIGPTALAWIDCLHEAGQRYWQALPLGPTGYGNSPYQLLSSFAGNELLVSPDGLIEDGFLQAADCEGYSFSVEEIDYDAVISFKRRLLNRAWTSFRAGTRKDVQAAYDLFRDLHGHWLDDYALFRALKAQHHDASYLEWPPELIRRAPDVLARAQRDLADQIDQIRFAQFVLFRQGERVTAYARAKGVRLIGDLPFFISPDSSDLWANAKLFLVDEYHRPCFVAGVPPDYFSAEGQLWGNPVYDWDAVRRDGYRWCIDRMRALLAHVDLVRLDHFRGFAAAWHVPVGEPTAKFGQWVLGPGADFFRAAAKELGALPFIAEDLGLITPDVTALRDKFELPGMRVLQFAFDGEPDNPHLPRNYASNTVVYTGTHDNPTTRAWFEELSDQQRQSVWDCLERPPGDSREVVSALIELAWSSRAALAMVPLQDLLDLGDEARMNQPGRADGNWCWRCTEEMLASTAFDWLRDVTKRTGRTAIGADGKDDAGSVGSRPKPCLDNP